MDGNGRRLAVKVKALRRQAAQLIGAKARAINGAVKYGPAMAIHAKDSWSSFSSLDNRLGFHGGQGPAVMASIQRHIVLGQVGQRVGLNATITADPVCERFNSLDQVIAGLQAQSSVFLRGYRRLNLVQSDIRKKLDLADCEYPQGVTIHHAKVLFGQGSGQHAGLPIRQVFRQCLTGGQRMALEQSPAGQDFGGLARQCFNPTAGIRRQGFAAGPTIDQVLHFVAQSFSQPFIPEAGQHNTRPSKDRSSQ